MTEQERLALDAKLSWPFKRWDVIANTEGSLIWLFEKVAYHWWNPEYSVGRDIFADFQQAISRQNGKWYVFENWCWDDDVYIDRNEHNLTAWYRIATEGEKRLFNALIQQKNKW